MPEDKYHIKEVHYRDLYGNLIWKDNIVFRHLWGVGNELVHDYKTYFVRRVAVADDVQHVNIEAVEHSVQRTTPTVPPCTCSMDDGIHEWNCAVEVARRSR